MKNSYPIRFVFFGHHKVASSWLHRLFWNIMCDTGICYDVYNHIGEQQREVLRSDALHKSRTFACGVSNSKPTDIELFSDFKALHVVRDPRDMVVSGYYSHRDSHKPFPGLLEEREKLRKSNLQDGLEIVMAGIMRQTFIDMLEWPHAPNVRTLQFESLTEDYTTIWDFFTETGLAESSREGFQGWIRRAWNQGARRCSLDHLMFGSRRITRNTFDVQLSRLDWDARRKRRKTARTGVGHHRPVDKKGWRELFTDQSSLVFEQMYPGLIRKWGYADSGT